MDNTLVFDDLITPAQCKELISKYSELEKKDLETYLAYEWRDLKFEEEPWLKPVLQLIITEYIKAFPSMQYTNTVFECESWRFKHFPPGYHFSNWHSEHSYIYPYRVACVILYLSDHNCGTEFFSNKEVIQSKMGRAVIFPTFWTHTHRGQLCPENKDRYIMSAYFNLTNRPS
jgi:hypothetical protein